MKIKYKLFCISLFLTIISFNIYANNEKNFLKNKENVIVKKGDNCALKIEQYKEMLKDKKLINAPNEDILKYLRSLIWSRGSISHMDYLGVAIKLYHFYPEKNGTVIRINLVKEMISQNEKDGAIEILLPIIDEARKRSVFWEYCSNWVFREVYPKELEGLYSLIKLYLEEGKIDKAIDILKIIIECYPFREVTVNSFLLFKDKISKFNKSQKSKFSQLMTNQMILIESEKWKELGLSKDNCKWLKEKKKLIFASKKIKEKPIKIKFYKFEFKMKMQRDIKEKNYTLLIAKVLPNSALVTCSFKWEIDGSYRVDKVFNNFVIIDNDSLKSKTVKLIIKDSKNKVIEKEYDLDADTIK